MGSLQTVGQPGGPQGRQTIRSHQGTASPLGPTPTGIAMGQNTEPVGGDAGRFEAQDLGQPSRQILVIEAVTLQHFVKTKSENT